MGFQAFPGTSQEVALYVPADEILFHGTRGNGKTIAQAMRFCRRVGLGYGSFWRGVIFARRYNSFDDLIGQTKRVIPKMWPDAQFKESKGSYKWVFDTGEELLLRAAIRPDDLDNLKGSEYPFIGWHELTNYPNIGLYQLALGLNRSSWLPSDSPGAGLTSIPLEVFSTTNADGRGHNWVKSYFIDQAPPGVTFKVVSYNIDNPRTGKKEDITRTRIHIFGSFRENPRLDPAYIANLMSMTASNENLRKSWLEGSWDFTAGGALDDLWDRRVHVIPRFSIPADWYVDRSFDNGSTHPFSVGWWALATGDTLELPAGMTIRGSNLWTPARNSLIQIAEYYGSEPQNIGQNKGIRLGARLIAQNIKQREMSLMAQGWIAKQPHIGPADSAAQQVRDSEQDSVANIMRKEGVTWEYPAKVGENNKRSIRLELFRDRLYNAVHDSEKPGIYFMENCVASIATIPVLPRDEDALGNELDDVDTNAEDHAYDMVCYRLLKGAHRLTRGATVQMPS